MVCHRAARAPGPSQPTAEPELAHGRENAMRAFATTKHWLGSKHKELLMLAVRPGNPHSTTHTALTRAPRGSYAVWALSLCESRATRAPGRRSGRLGTTTTAEPSPCGSYAVWALSHCELRGTATRKLLRPSHVKTRAAGEVRAKAIPVSFKGTCNEGTSCGRSTRANLRRKNADAWRRRKNAPLRAWGDNQTPGWGSSFRAISATIVCEGKDTTPPLPHKHTSAPPLLCPQHSSQVPYLPGSLGTAAQHLRLETGLGSRDSRAGGALSSRLVPFSLVQCRRSAQPERARVAES